MADYAKAIELNPKNAKAYTNRGLLNKERRKYRKAFSDFNKAIKVNPKYADAYRARAFHYLHRKKNNSLALADFKKASKLEPAGPGHLVNLAVAYNHMRKYRLAIKHANKAFKTRRLSGYGKKAAYSNRAFAYAKIKNYKRALKDYSQIIKLEPRRAQNYINRAKMYTKLGDEKRAYADAKKAYKLNPKILKK